MNSMLTISGRAEGLATSITSPSVLCTRYATDGAVAIRSRLNSRTRRSRMISMWSRPRNPHRNPKPERAGGLRLVGVGAVVEAQLLEGVAQVGELVAVDRVEAAEHHRLRLAVPLERRRRRADGVGDRLAGAGLPHVLDAGDEVAGLARAERRHRRVVRAAHADLVGVVDGVGLHELHAAAGLERAGHHPHRRHHAAVAVVVRVEDQGLERVGRITGRRGDVLDDGVEQLGHAVAGLGADAQDVVGRGCRAPARSRPRTDRGRRPGGRAC